MDKIRILLFGFCNMLEFTFSAMVRELTGVKELEIVHTLEELDSLDRETLVDMIAVNLAQIGFNMDNQLQRIALHFPEAYILCISPFRISRFIALRLIQNGVDALIANIDSQVEFKRAKAAVQGKRKYYPPEIRRMLDEDICMMSRGYSLLSVKEHDAMVLTLKGLTLKEIAAEMKIAKTTACTTRKNAFRKMGVTNLVEFVKMGYEFNLHATEGNKSAV